MSRHPNARFNLGCGVQDLALIDDEIRVTTPKGEFALDFLIFSTGFRIDWTARPEFAALARTCAPGATATRPPPATRTRNCMTPRPGPRLRAAGKIARRLSGLDRVHCFSYPAALTHGTVSGDIPAISEGAKRLAQGIAGLFYREDVAAHYANMEAFSEPEVFGDEWTPAPPPSAVSAQPATAAAPTQARTHTAPATAATETAK